MHTALEQMLKGYDVDTIYDRKNAMKEIMQEIVLFCVRYLECGFFQADYR